MSAGTVTSEMAATVWQILVGVGQPVAAGDTLVVLESMKMEVPVTAAVAGTVTHIHVSEGDIVADGTPLVQIG